MNVHAGRCGENSDPCKNCNENECNSDTCVFVNNKCRDKKKLSSKYCEDHALILFEYFFLLNTDILQLNFNSTSSLPQFQP